MVMDGDELSTAEQEHEEVVDALQRRIDGYERVLSEAHGALLSAFSADTQEHYRALPLDELAKQLVSQINTIIDQRTAHVQARVVLGDDAKLILEVRQAALSLALEHADQLLADNVITSARTFVTFMREG